MALYNIYYFVFLLPISVVAKPGGPDHNPGNPLGFPIPTAITISIPTSIPAWLLPKSKVKQTPAPSPPSPAPSPTVTEQMTATVTAQPTSLSTSSQSPSSGIASSTTSEPIAATTIAPSASPELITTTSSNNSGVSAAAAFGGATETQGSSQSSSSTVLSPPISTTSSSTEGQAAASPTVNNQVSAAGKNNLGVIIGCSVGGIAFLAILALIALLIWDRKRKYRNRQTPSPFSTPTEIFDGDLMVKNRSRGAGGGSDYSRPFGFIRRLKSSSSSSKRSYVDRWRKQSMSVVTSRISEEKHRDDASDAPCLSSVITAETRYPRMPGILGPRTDRQMELEQKIQDLKGRLIFLNHEREDGMSVEGVNGEINQVMARIRRLEELEFSDWALERTNKAPSEIFSQVG